MNTYDVKRLALILAIQAEIEGMKMDNKVRELNGTLYCNYSEYAFNEKAEQLRNLAACHGDQL